MERSLKPLKTILFEQIGHPVPLFALLTIDAEYECFKLQSHLTLRELPDTTVVGSHPSASLANFGCVAVRSLIPILIDMFAHTGQPTPLVLEYT